jgi:hypothetical protein
VTETLDLDPDVRNQRATMLLTIASAIQDLLGFVFPFIGVSSYAVDVYKIHKSR